MQLTDEQIMLQEMVKNFTQNEITPIAGEMDQKGYLPDDIFLKLGKLGILGITIPEEYGGSGADVLSQVLAVEEISKGDSGVGLSMVAHGNLCVHNIYKNGNEYQRNKYLPKLCSGEHIGALCLTEPEAGSDAMGIKTKAERDGDIYRLNGSKTFITNAPVADTFLIYAKTDMSKGAHGISAFILEKNFEGLSVSKKLEKTGNRSSPTGEVFLEDCIVPEKNLLVGENMGGAVVMSGLDVERVVVSALCLGVAKAAFEDSLNYSRERKQFGNAISEFQLIQAKLADMYTQIEAARALVYNTAIRIQKQPRLRKESAATVLFAAEMCEKVCYDAMQIHGGYGYMADFPVERYWRDARLYTIGAGTSEIRRILIANELLRE